MAAKKKTTTKRKKTAKRAKPAGKRGRTTDLAPGTVIEKTFKGAKHTVQVTAEGYLHKGKAYASLTAVALAITGYKAVSGPRFFGTDAKGGAE
ncbi:MAG: DUF2924 domain-containing protein [Dehalococcoidia bacterium]